jgi:uroporphyrinogen III methyltransferase/synthase
VAYSFAVITGHRASDAEDVSYNWEHLANGPDTLLFLMGVSNLDYIVAQLVAHGRSPETPVALVERASRTAQKTVSGTLADIVERAVDIRPPAIIIIGEVVSLRQSLRWFDRPERHPLLGLRVLNTRPLDQAGEFSRRLMELGAEAVELPTTQIGPVGDPGPLDKAIGRLSSDGPGWDTGPGWDHLIFASANSVSFFIDRLLELGRDVRSLTGVRLVVLGQATAAALRNYGLVADFIPSRQTSRDLLAEIGDVAGQRILLSRSNVPLSGLAEGLRARGAVVETVEAYAVRPVEPDPVALSALVDGGIDVVTFVSPSAVTGLAAMLEGRLGESMPSPPAVACLGPATVEAARAAGLQVEIIPERHTVDGLLEALVGWCGSA